jgi:hypothetical protein
LSEFVSLIGSPNIQGLISSQCVTGAWDSVGMNHRDRRHLLRQCLAA